ncbi:MAG: hypothetical protein KJ666_18085 [Bacteroidetes bacterium]|nr:hypothetical protein [Bacteroidota bacterium]MBU2583708.1 hypothetical protein [Bacteroidota bacterium]
MFHSLGSPDLYHYSFDGLQPVYKWDIMEWNLNPPQHMGAYMKFRYGSWISSIPVIATSGNYSLNSLTSSSNNCYRINSPNSSSEYFILEYRRRSGTFENSLPGDGLLVYRINTSRDGLGNSNGPPDEVYIYRPNGTTSSNGNPSNANFSSDVGRTSITDISNPSSFLSNGNSGGLNISNIGSIGNSISFIVTIPGSSIITVTSPNGGENWQAGSTQSITWTSSGVSTVNIEYTTNNGSNWTTIIASTPAGAGSYAWTVPNTPSSQCRVRISDASNSSVNDLSDGIFTISPAPAISILSPNGGESWQVGTNQNITWTSTSISNVKIEYTTNNGTSWSIIIATTPASNGSYSWVIPNTPSSQCKVRISDATNSILNSVSNNSFTISPVPTITLISPNGGESWQVGTNQNITWTSSTVTNLKIEYTTNNGSNWLPIVTSTPASAGIYSWTIPSTPSNQCRVKVSDASNLSLNDQSDNVFTLLPLPPNAPVLKSPQNNMINLPTTVSLIWNRVTNADGYILQLFDSTSINVLLTDSTITDTSKQLTSLVNRTKYYWHVRAKNDGGWSSFSETWNFRVMNLKGDLDGNNLIQALDASYILQNAVGLRDFDSMQSFAADVNNDNIVGAYDAAWILYFVVYGIWPNW